MKTANTLPEPQWPPLDASDYERVQAAMQAGGLSYNIDPSEVHALEARFRNYSGHPYCLALNSGTSALQLAFMALHLGEHDEILAPTFTFPATVLPLLHLKAKLRLIDSAPDSPNFGVKEVEPHLHKGVKAIVVSHMDGIPADVPALRKLCDRHGIILIEDCAQALGGTYGEYRVGELADMAIYSLQQRKLVCGGEGGILCMRRQDIYQKAMLLGYLQKRPSEELMETDLGFLSYTGLGYNLRIHPLAAALANSQFDKHAGFLQKHRAFASIFLEGIASIPELLVPAPECPLSARTFYSLKLIVRPRRIALDTLAKRLQAEGVPVFKSMTRPLHREPLFRKRLPSWVGFDNSHLLMEDGQTFPGAENYAEDCLRLSPTLDPADARIYAAAFQKVFTALRHEQEETASLWT